ncbi:hypothetical protein [Microbacterium sp. No. 7]|uniref:hypothetical protein n=1 Tax=Microbacterium sp. No. 7 TaxID=1714373 RepID=UPI0006D16E33|nr:hypothetical protein [Microbacterium sp. No. 7]ALJ21712.1 hypothetical protein AOA12_18170 [Microbacterium sp. No. 7]
MTNRTIASAGLAALTAAALAVAPSAAAAVDVAADGSTCIQRLDDGSQTWIGSATTEFNALAEELGELFADHPGRTTGIAACTHYDGLMVFLPPRADDEGQDAFDEELSRIVRSHPEYPVYTTEVAAASVVLVPLATEIVATLHDEGVVGAAPDVYTGGLHVTVDSLTVGMPESLRSRIDEVVQRSAGMALPLRLSVQEGPYEAAVATVARGSAVDVLAALRLLFAAVASFAGGGG